MTSNIGTSLYAKTQMGYQSDLDGNRVSRNALVKSLKRFFSPEFLNRIDEIVVFNHLEIDDIRKIIEIQLKEVRNNIEKQGKRLLVREKVFDHIIEKYYSREYGARNISRALKSELLEKIAGLSLGKEWHDAQTIVCAMKKRQIDIRLEELNTLSEEKVVLMEKCNGK
jgi:ATP-dependent Clp protease ATP-binding subunit ClpC